MHLRGGNVMENRLDRLEQRLEELESKLQDIMDLLEMEDHEEDYDNDNPADDAVSYTHLTLPTT